VQGGENNSDVSDGSSSISAGMIGGIAGGISALIFGVFGGLWYCKSKQGGSKKVSAAAKKWTPPSAAPPRSRDPRATETERAAYELSGGKRPANQSLSGGKPPVV